MINLPKLVTALIAISACFDIADKARNWGRDKKNEKEKKQDEPPDV